MAKISIIVPVYKVEPYIHRCIDSILNQTYPDFELILVDDGSPDNCGAICDEYAATDSRIHVIHQENSGVSVARNVALDWVFTNSDSQWLTFIDSDDWVHPQYLEMLLKVVTESGCKIGMCRYARIKEGQEVPHEDTKGTWKWMTTDDAYIWWARKLAAVHSPMWSRIYDKEALRGIRFPVGKYWEDLYIMPRILYQCENIPVLDGAYYYYYWAPFSTTNKPWGKHNLDRLSGYEENLRFFRKRQNKDMELHSAKAVCRVIAEEQYGAQRSDLPDREKRKIQRMLQRKMRYMLIRYGKRCNMTVQSDFAAYYTAFKPLFVIYEHATFLQKPYRALRALFRK